MPLPTTVTVGPLAVADPDNICLSQTPGGAVAMTINGAAATGGVATLDVARRVLITSAGNDSGITFRITGANSDGNPIRETVTGPNATTAYTVQDFKTVTEVRTSAAAAGAVTVGTNGVASSPWKLMDYYQTPANMSIGVLVSGTVNYSVEYTYDDVQAPNGIGSALGNYPPVPTLFSHASLVAKTANFDGVINDPIRAWRLTLNSQTNPGYATATGIQAGMGGT